MRDVAVIGCGITKFGEMWKKSIRDIFTEAALQAIDDAKVDHIDSMYVGNMSGGLFVGQEHIGALMADYLGQKNIPAVRVEGACASGGLAVRQAFIEVASGISEIVLAGGVEKMTDGADVTYALASAADREYEAYHGITFPGLFAIVANAHMHRYGTTRKQLALVAVKNHKHGSLNPLAQFRSQITVEAVLASPPLADPLRVLDSCPVSDGAAAVILCPLDVAKKMGKTPIKIVASSLATDTIALHQRDEITRFKAVERAAEEAYRMAGIQPTDIDVAELHDCFTIAEICQIEDIGLCEKGKGGKFVEDGLAGLEGKIPINTSGGLKAKGHPVGATGVAQVVEIVEQLLQKAGKRQVKEPKLGLTLNFGGTGATVVVHIFKVV
jgi:acetyl-CoA C-acetyltransferase